MAIVFDLDGTLLDHAHAVDHGLSSLTTFGAELRIYAEAELKTLWLKAEEKYFPKAEIGEMTFAEHRRARLKEVFPTYCAKLSDSQLDKLYREYARGYADNWTLYSDVEGALERFKDVAKAIITNGGKEMQVEKVRRTGLSKHFPQILISESFGFAKPDARIFLEACRNLGVNPADTQYVGDSFRNDVEGSLSAGMQAVWLNRTGKQAPRRDLNFREISSLEDL